MLTFTIKEYKKPETDEDMILKMKYLQAADPQNDVQNLMVIDGVTVKKNGRKMKMEKMLISNNLKTHICLRILMKYVKKDHMPKQVKILIKTT